MAESLIRAQMKPAPGVWGRLLDVNGPTTLSTIRGCSVGVLSDEVNIRIALAGVDEDDKQFLCERTPVFKGLPYSMTEGVTLIEGDVVWVKSLDGSVAFSLFGVESA